MKWFNGQKGYGFIQPDDGGEDVFVHISVVQRAGMSSLNEGQKVVFEVVPDRKTGKRRVGRAARALSSPCAWSARLGQEWVKNGCGGNSTGTPAVTSNSRRHWCTAQVVRGGPKAVVRAEPQSSAWAISALP